ncbi:hypothetical protein BV914_11985 [Neisseria dumasiana]|nr:hypothetical protein BV914_11985 [Neisseria dumasiana]
MAEALATGNPDPVMAEAPAAGNPVQVLATGKDPVLAMYRDLFQVRSKNHKLYPKMLPLDSRNKNLS